MSILCIAAALTAALLTVLASWPWIGGWAILAASASASAAYVAAAFYVTNRRNPSTAKRPAVGDHGRNSVLGS